MALRHGVTDVRRRLPETKVVSRRELRLRGSRMSLRAKCTSEQKNIYQQKSVRKNRIPAFRARSASRVPSSLNQSERLAGRSASRSHGLGSVTGPQHATASAAQLRATPTVAAISCKKQGQGHHKSNPGTLALHGDCNTTAKQRGLWKNILGRILIFQVRS